MKTWSCAACHQDDVPRYHARAIVCELCRDSARARGLAWCSGRGLRSPHRVALDALSGGAVKRAWCRACERAWQNRHQPYAKRLPYLERWRAEHKAHIQDYKRRYVARNRARVAAVRRARYDRVKLRAWRAAR